MFDVLTPQTHHALLRRSTRSSLHHCFSNAEFDRGTSLIRKTPPP